MDRAGGAYFENQCAVSHSSAQSLMAWATTFPLFVKGRAVVEARVEGLVGVRVDGRFQSVVIEAIGVDRGRRACTLAGRRRGGLAK